MEQKVSLIDEVAMIQWLTWASYISQTIFFLSRILSNHIVENNREKFKQSYDNFYYKGIFLRFLKENGFSSSKRLIRFTKSEF